MRAEHGPDRKREQQNRKRQHDVDRPGEKPVDGAAQETGDDADHAANSKRNERGCNADQERDAGAVDGAGQQIAAVLICPQPEMKLPAGPLGETELGRHVELMTQVVGRMAIDERDQGRTDCHQNHNHDVEQAEPGHPVTP